MKAIQKQQWGLLIIPLELLIGAHLFRLSKNPKVTLLASTALVLIGTLLMIWLFHDFLKEQWHHYRQKLFLRLLVSIILVVGAFLILQVARRMLPSELLQLRTPTGDSLQILSPSWTVLAAVIPFIAPFTEELTFRYLLLGQFSSKTWRMMMFFVQSILFGLIHWNNFNGNVYAMIPYMVLGLYFGGIYLLSGNIWSSIIVHWMLNTMNSMLPALLLLFLKFF